MYSVYTLKSPSHICKPLTDHELPNDSVAIEEAKKLLEKDPIDVWCGNRFIAHLDPE